ncbi:MAG: monofunctional biosynthetic peptidoglycan transglycosylase [Elusimicrobia bacterium CG11_big_fil_rev_8_21_14_0_20_64_6]|nr:MAG: monofunctional biosynthetic peptidoglycan transglycosylase [Elusimicrobia bacterium CG11_big_fil_rev_8_21_14_0_20_64_6]
MLAYPPKLKRASPPILRPLLLGLLLGAAASLLWVLWLPDVTPLKKRPPKTTAYMELRKSQSEAKGKKLKLRWTWTAFDAISEHLKKAVVTAEDDEFWRHDGVNWAAIRVAYEKNRKVGRFAAGGSTLTMQLARNLYLSPSKNPLRKAKEILIARRLERELGKRRILELYLNVVEWGDGVFGCEAAARIYYEKSCADLSETEAVALAVVLPNPRRWNPAKYGSYVERNSKRILGRIMKADRQRAGDEDVDEDILVEDEVQSDSTTRNSSSGSALTE